MLIKEREIQGEEKSAEKVRRKGFGKVREVSSWREKSCMIVWVVVLLATSRKKASWVVKKGENCYGTIHKGDPRAVAGIVSRHRKNT